MTIAEYVFAVIGILIIIGGFAYGIYDSYLKKHITNTSLPPTQKTARTNIRLPALPGFPASGNPPWES